MPGISRKKRKGDSIGSSENIPRCMLLAGNCISLEQDKANQWSEYRKYETKIYIAAFTRNPAESCSEPPVQVVSTHRLHGSLEIKEQFKKKTQPTVKLWELHGLFILFQDQIILLACYTSSNRRDQKSRLLILNSWLCSGFQKAVKTVLQLQKMLMWIKISLSPPRTN